MMDIMAVIQNRLGQLQDNMGKDKDKDNKAGDYLAL